MYTCTDLAVEPIRFHQISFSITCDVVHPNEQNLLLAKQKYDFVGFPNQLVLSHDEVKRMRDDAVTLVMVKVGGKSKRYGCI